VRGHADAETLAAFREELLSRRKAARVSAHLAACSRCAGLDAQLTEVSALLTRSTAPPMPDALTARIEAAIAAEAAARAATTADGTVAAGAAGSDGGARPAGQRAGRAARPPAGPRRTKLALRVAAVTAAVAVVAGGGYGVARLLAGNHGAGTTASEGAPFRERRPAPGVAAGGAGAGASGSHAFAGITAPAARIVSSGTNYQPSQLKAQVSAVLAEHRGNITAAPAPATANGPAGAARQLPACVAPVTGGARPLLVDHARYQGRPATVIVVPAGHGRLRALVVAGGCTATTGHVLATTTIPASG
jgi:hypothetical protein